MVADNSLFFAACAGYFTAGVCYIAQLIWGGRALLIAGRLIAGVGLAANTLALAARILAAGHLPGTSMYEFGMMMVWLAAVFCLFLEWRRPMPVFSALLLLLAFVLSGVFLSFYQEAKPLIPALKSDWLLAHVVTAVIAYGALAVSFCAALGYFWHKRFCANEGRELLTKLAALADNSILFAMPFLTLLLITGAVWAEYAWGSYWRWDPKETWSLITWMIYSIYLHGRLMKHWSTGRAMGLAVAGFIAVLFTFVGVNVLLPGLHSYAR